MRATCQALAVLLLPLLLLLLRGTHLTGAAPVSVGADVDKEVAPVGDVTTDLLSLEPEIGGSVVRQQRRVQEHQRGARRARGIFFSAWGNGYGWSFAGQGYGYGSPYGSPYGIAPTYYGYYPGYLGYQKIIIG